MADRERGRHGQERLRSQVGSGSLCFRVRTPSHRERRADDWIVENSALIDAPPAAVWRTLTNPILMKQWMAEPDLRIEIVTDWKVGSPFIVSGHHNTQWSASECDRESSSGVMEAVVRESRSRMIFKNALPDRALECRALSTLPISFGIFRFVGDDSSSRTSSLCWNRLERGIGRLVYRRSRNPGSSIGCRFRRLASRFRRPGAMREET